MITTEEHAPAMRLPERGRMHSQHLHPGWPALDAMVDTFAAAEMKEATQKWREGQHRMDGETASKGTALRWRGM